jgi:hypothetical protein
VRTVKTASGATAVQIVYSNRRGSRDIEHIGSAHDEARLELLKAAARQRLAAGQGELDLGVSGAAGRAGRVVDGGPLPITSTRMAHLWDALGQGFDLLGFDAASEGDEVFRQLVLARIIEPSSKLDSARVLEEAGIEPCSYPTLKRRLPVYAQPSWRQALAAACAAHAGLGRASLVLFDVSTLYFETDTGDGFREPGFSKERRLEPQITVGLLTDQRGFPLMVSAFEGNKAETTTMIPTIQAFRAAHGPDRHHRGRRRGHGLSGQPAGNRSGRAVVHPRRPPPGRALRSQEMASGPPRRGHPRRPRLCPALAGWTHRPPPRPGHLLPVPP